MLLCEETSLLLLCLLLLLLMLLLLFLTLSAEGLYHAEKKYVFVIISS